ncbi:GMP reductase 2-like [Neodiprion fabricii]|uniref:GMP reductase 2-like n=1 Tax=Neodiprion fabricii TaxID=2872261 RepID=UPI0015EDDD50|nr:GMP reductase 2-like [Neodiprion fabricii]
MSKIINDVKLDYKDVLIRPRRSTIRSRADIDLFAEMKFRNSKRIYEGIPIMAANMESTGTFEMAKALSKHGLFTAVHKYNTLEEWKAFAASSPECLHNVSVSVGISPSDLKLLSDIIDAIPELSIISLDIANAHIQVFLESIKQVRSAYPNHTIVAGDVAIPEMVEEIILTGADIVKVGIGGGSVCTTRLKTGVGYPQLSAVLECAHAAHGVGGHIIADGGCINVGDLAKAFGAGADFVMIGGMLAGHDQSGGKIIKRDGKLYSQFYGLCSRAAMEKHYGGVAEYRAAEGKEVEIPYKGDVEATILDMLGGLRSACTYVGAKRLQELYRQTTFIRCTQQSNPVFESAPSK